MCFTKNHSFFNALILAISSIYTYPNIRLSSMLIFLAIKDFIQGLLYQFQNNDKMKNILTSISWIHICLQPLFINGFVERDVKADLKMPEEFTITNQLEPLNTPELLPIGKLMIPEEKNLVN